jgi:hypothetical protein
MAHDGCSPADFETWALVRRHQRLAGRLAAIDEFVDRTLLIDLTNELDRIGRAVRQRLTVANVR